MTLQTGNLISWRSKWDTRQETAIIVSIDKHIVKEKLTTNDRGITRGKQNFLCTILLNNKILKCCVVHTVNTYRLDNRPFVMRWHTDTDRWIDRYDYDWNCEITS